MARPTGATNVRPTREELAAARRLTKRLALDGNVVALGALAAHRLADALERPTVPPRDDDGDDEPPRAA